MSIVKPSVPDAPDALPAGSVSVAWRVWPPADRVLVVIDHAPLLTVAEPIGLLPSYKVTVSPLAVPTPLITGVTMLVMSSPGTPVSLAGARVRPDGAVGGMVSIVRVKAGDAADTAPAALVSLAVR